MNSGFVQASARLQLDLAPGTPAGDLPLSVQQQIEILRALHTEARVLVLDEPTAALGQRERVRLLEIVGAVRNAGSAVLFISHHLDEVLAVSDTVTVLRNGRVAASGSARSFSMAQLTSAMIGRAVDVLERRRPPLMETSDTSPALEVDGLRTASGLEVHHLSLRPGEMVGLAGLVGSGRSRLLRSLAGLERPMQGRLRVDGVDLVWPRNPRRAASHGIALAPEDRRTEGLNLRQRSWTNMTINTLARPQRLSFVRRRRALQGARELAGLVDLQTEKLAVPVGTLSGGNQQKVVLARLLYQRPSVLLVDEPMRGIDVGAKEEIFGTIEATALDGNAVLVASEETEDLLAVCDRVVVMRHGRVAMIVEGLAQRDLAYAAMLGTSHPAPERRAS
jgi:ABC-type sugar transport system ATPase subunit